MPEAGQSGITDADRQRVVERLRRQAGPGGQLTLDEYTSRVARAYRVQTRIGLDGIVADLPPEPEPTATPGAEPEPWALPGESTVPAAAPALVVQDAYRSPPMPPPSGLVVQDAYVSERQRRNRRVVVAVTAGSAVLLLVAVAAFALVVTDRSDRSGGEERAGPLPSVASTPPETVPPSTTVDAPATTATSSPPATEDFTPSGLEPEVVLVVGQDIQPGRYVSSDAGFVCSWDRLSGLGGTIDEVIAFNSTFGQHQIVDILASDAGLRTQGCGEWQPYAAPATPATTLDLPGDWLVGSDIAAGTYRSSGPTGELGCYWERASGFSHEIDEVLDNGYTDQPATVELHAGERLSTDGCGTWTLQ